MPFSNYIKGNIMLSKKIQAENHKKWKLLVEEHEKSGQTLVVFCKERNLSPKRLSYYRRLFRISNNKEIKNPTIFVPIQLKKPDPNVLKEIRIVLPNGFQCVIPWQSDMSQVKQLIGVLLSC